MTGYQVERGGMPDDIAAILAEKRARAEKIGIGISILRAEGGVAPSSEVEPAQPDTETGASQLGSTASSSEVKLQLVKPLPSTTEAGHTFMRPRIKPVAMPNAA